MKPEWADFDEVELAEYIEDIQALFDLSKMQATHLRYQLKFRLQGVWLGKSLGEEEARRQLADDGIFIEQKHRGAGLGERTVTLTRRTGEAFRRALREGGTIRRMRKAMARRPFTFALNRDLKSKLENALWSSGCLQIEYGQWLVPLKQHEPFEGTWWYVEQIRRLLGNANNQCATNDSEFAAYNAFKAGELFGELQLVLAHNEFFQKQQAISEAQKNAPRQRRKHSDEARRGVYRKFLSLGDKPIHAAENAAKELGVSLSTIRRAFPGGRLPEATDDF